MGPSYNQNWDYGQRQRPSFSNYASTVQPSPPPPQPSPRIFAIPAAMIQEEDQIKPNMVPNDGTIALFMQDDYSAIYAKAFNSRGTIDNVKYVPEMRPQVSMDDVSNNDRQSEQMQNIFDQLSAIREGILELTTAAEANQQPVTIQQRSQKNNSKQQKEEPSTT